MRNNEQKIIFESPLHFQTYCYKNQWIYGGTNVSTDWQTNRPTDRITDWQCDLFRNHFVGVAPKGRCPVGHRGEFLYVLRGHIWGLWNNFPWYSMGVKHFVQFLINLPCYLIGISHFFHFPSIFHVTELEVCILSISHVIQWEFEAWEAQGGGRTDVRTDVWEFTPVS